MYPLSLNLVKFYISDSLRLTVKPSNNVAVNQSVTLQCNEDPNESTPLVVIFRIQTQGITLCVLEPTDGACRNTTNPCITRYNASCAGPTRYSIQVTVPKDWNGMSVDCQTLIARSNSIVFFVTGTEIKHFTSNLIEREKCHSNYRWPTIQVVFSFEIYMMFFM